MLGKFLDGLRQWPHDCHISINLILIRYFVIIFLQDRVENSSARSTNPLWYFWLLSSFIRLPQPGAPARRSPLNDQCKMRFPCLLYWYQLIQHLVKIYPVFKFRAACLFEWTFISRIRYIIISFSKRRHLTFYELFSKYKSWGTRLFSLFSSSRFVIRWRLKNTS